MTTIIGIVGALHRSLRDSATSHYVLLLLFQVHRVWAVWRVRDLTSGDTSHYFYDAVGWSERTLTNIVWSPLYTIYWGMLVGLFEHAYILVIVHRLVLVLLLAFLVLAIFRYFFPPALAWLAAAWCCFLPTAFDTMYEVHLFSALPPLLICFTLLKWPTMRGRASAVCMLIVSTVLVRNEFLIITLIFLTYCAIVDFYRPWRRHRSLADGLGTYAFGFSAGILILGVCFAHNRLSTRDLGSALHSKHTLNVCQIYAYGYQQRNSDFTGSPWTDCHILMKRQFGTDFPTLRQAVLSNPAAMLSHVSWNAQLIPAGLELLLFAKSGFDNTPDYMPITPDDHVHMYTVGLLIVSSIGFWSMFRFRNEKWIPDTSCLVPALWLTTGVVVSSLFVSLMQRPRPSYLIAFQVVFIGIIVFSVHVIVKRIGLHQYLQAAFPLLSIALVFYVPSYYTNLHPLQERRLLNIYERIRIHSSAFQKSDVRLLSSEFPVELCSYLGRRPGACQPISPPSQFKSMKDLSEFLARTDANLAYVSAGLLNDETIQSWVRHPGTLGWTTLGVSQGSGSRWFIVAKAEE